jgi:hypothetical protein
MKSVGIFNTQTRYGVKRKIKKKTVCDKRYLPTVYVDGVFEVTLIGARARGVFRVEVAIKILSRLTSGYLWALNI